MMSAITLSGGHQVAATFPCSTINMLGFYDLLQPTSVEMSYDVVLWPISPHGYIDLKCLALGKSCHWCRWSCRRSWV